MVADIIIIAVFALLFFIDFKRGIAITILNVAGVALTGFRRKGEGGNEHFGIRRFCALVLTS